MNKIVDRLKNRLVSMLGLDFEIDFQDEKLSQISADLYLGSRPKIKDVEILKKIGITHIVSCLNLEKHSELTFLEQDFQTIFLPVRDGVDENITSVLPSFFDFVSMSENSSPKAKVLVHCEAGVSRSATLVIALLMIREQISFYDAFLAVRSKRAKVLPNIGFASQLQSFEHATSQEKPVTGLTSSLSQYLHQICNVPLEIELLQAVLEAHDFKALPALHAIFGDDIPRVIQGVRL